MSYARGVGQNGLKLYSNITMPGKIDMSFVVDATNGLGVTSPKSNGYVHSIFMNTSATPTSMNGSLNPNPAAGYCQLQFKNNFNTFLGIQSSFVAPNSATAATGTIVSGTVYIIAALGTTTLAQWQAKGLPVGFVPTIGQVFVATASGALGGTGTVKVPGVSGISGIEVVGVPSTMISNKSLASSNGAILTLMFVGPTSSSVTTPIAVAPAAGTIVNVSAFFDLSSVTIDGL